MQESKDIVNEIVEYVKNLESLISKTHNLKIISKKIIISEENETTE
jgi:hypothetical protein